MEKKSSSKVVHKSILSMSQRTKQTSSQSHPFDWLTKNRPLPSIYGSHRTPWTVETSWPDETRARSTLDLFFYDIYFACCFPFIAIVIIIVIISVRVVHLSWFTAWRLGCCLILYWLCHVWDMDIFWDPFIRLVCVCMLPFTFDKRCKLLTPIALSEVHIYYRPRTLSKTTKSKQNHLT